MKDLYNRGSKLRTVRFSERSSTWVYECKNHIDHHCNGIFSLWEGRCNTICVVYICPPDKLQSKRGETKTFHLVRVLAELCSILSRFGQSQFKQIFIFFSCSISTECLFSSDKASLSQTLLLSCTSIITENCTVCSIFAN